MATIQDEVVEGFLSELGESDRVDRDLIKTLRALLEASGKLKADDFVKAYTATNKENGV